MGPVKCLSNVSIFCVDHGHYMFKTDGSVHHGGVKNEDQTIQILNELKIYSSTVEKRGGTTQKADAVAGDKKISIKRKEGIANGSFDWFNTSKYNDALGNTFDAFLSTMKEMRSMPKDLIKDDCIVFFSIAVFFRIAVINSVNTCSL